VARGAPSRVAAAASEGGSAPPPLAGILIECDGVMTDLHMSGHREAFNRAFAGEAPRATAPGRAELGRPGDPAPTARSPRPPAPANPPHAPADLGLECANWSPVVYADLLSRGDGTAESLIAEFFATIGWPTFIPTGEEMVFAGKVHERKLMRMEGMIEADEIPLRDGALELVTQATQAGAKVGLLCATASLPEDGVAASVKRRMGTGLGAGVPSFTVPGAGGEEGGERGLEESLRERQAEVKRGLAQAAAEALR